MNEQQKALEETVDQLITEADKAAFEVLNRIATLVLNQVLQ